MDKNIAAILRNDARTVQCTFELDMLSDADIASPEGYQRILESSGDWGKAVGQLQPPKLPGSKSAGQLYTYVTDLPLRPNDVVAVPVQGSIKLVRVVTVDDTASIEPNSLTEYKWIICKVDLLGYAENLRKNAEIESTVAEATRSNMRSVFQNQVLGGMNDANKSRLGLLLGVEKKADAA